MDFLQALNRGLLNLNQSAELAAWRLAGFPVCPDANSDCLQHLSKGALAADQPTVYGFDFTFLWE